MMLSITMDQRWDPYPLFGNLVGVGGTVQVYRSADEEILWMSKQENDQQ